MRAEKRIIMDNLVITVARGFGSCGKRIAKQIADDLGIHCYENRILMLRMYFRHFLKDFQCNVLLK